MRTPPSGYNAIELESLTDTELRDAHYELSTWVEDALGIPLNEAPSDDLYDDIHERLSAISRVRALRQKEDLGTSDSGRF